MIPHAKLIQTSPRQDGGNEAMNGTDYLMPGDPIPPGRTGGMPGFVVGECGHRVAASEWRAGFRNCERCGESGEAGDPDL